MEDHTMSSLQNKRVLITGGSTGIGLETARQFRAEGARVAITGNNAVTLDAAVAALGPDVIAIRADAGRLADLPVVADTVRDRFGGLDAVFVNAGIGDFRPLEQWDEAGFDRSVAVNLKGPFFLVQALLPLLANPASIILNASTNARIGMPATTIYAATKAGLVSLARTLSGELIGRGIRVNAVSPGPVATPLHDELGLTGAALDDLVGQIPLGRRGTPYEIARMVVLLASDAGAFAVGSEFVLDGGMTNL
jgi:NAD(P)-dependent dehydrogenase (short-subunit alcohol dehydrogenase family)